MTQKPTLSNPNIPTEESLRALLKVSGMEDAVQQLLDQYPQLKFKLEKNPQSNQVELVDALTGAALWLKRFITEDADTIAMKRNAAKIADVNDEVLIVGETGTGKEILARCMLGDKQGKFIRINCAALPEQLLESELFGHVKGAFTGADQTKRGMVFEATGGVLFLDEIGEMSPLLQAKLLNVLQPIDGRRSARPVGANEEKEINCRFVFATHRNLNEMMEKGQFRRDLYARISTFELYIKPLRKRKEDIKPILKEIARLLGIEQKVEDFLSKYQDDIMNDQIDLSLNVRSLERMLKRFNTLGNI